MVNPTTVNVGLIVPLTGADVDTWGEDDVNPNMSAVDGLFGGVQILSVSNVPITLTSPAGFTPTPGAGPTQSQNRVLRFTGTLTGNVRVTLPIPGVYVVENLTTVNAFTLTFQGITATEVVAVPTGSAYEIYNDGSNVRFVNLGPTASLMMYGTVGTTPAWISACTVKPYLLCDGTVYNISDYPTLGSALGSAFGGNGLTTFAVPDLRGRIPLSYDGTGTRITVAGCGINGQTIGASQDKQTNTLLVANLPPITSSATQSITVAASGPIPVGNIAINTINVALVAGSSQTLAYLQAASGGSWSGASSISGSNAISVTSVSTVSTPVNNVQPVQVVGSWMIKT